ncbi:MAG TPA: biotin/lipoyl-containing protein [Bacteroidales bacterium]|nr:biotin/lipoyl-containing protein [Bacteroidales bacterium]
MKTYKITVNGKVYMVEVEEAGANETSAAPVKESAPAAPAAASTDEKIEAPIQGTIMSIKVAAGTPVKKGQILAILEAMKLENEIVSPFDGTVSAVHAKDGQVVDSGALLMTISTK